MKHLKVFEEYNDDQFHSIESGISIELGNCTLIQPEDEVIVKSYLDLNFGRSITYNVVQMENRKSRIQIKLLNYGVQIVIYRNFDEYYILQYDGYVPSGRQHDNWFKCDEKKGLYQCLEYLIPIIKLNKHRGDDLYDEYEY